jgi:uncharacterized caspase-like protein
MLGGEGVKDRIVLAALLLLILAVPIFASSVQPQPQLQVKGGVNLQAIEASRGKPSDLKPSHGAIATGVVSYLPEGGDKWAVIIGISDYSGTINDLNYCDDDAQEFYNALLGYGWLPSHVKLLIDEKATKQNIMDAIVWMEGKEGASDEVVFFYSGHGTTSNYDVDDDGEKKDECIVPWECDTAYFIWDGNLKQSFEGFESKRIMFYFDSCFSGGMTDLAGDGRLILMASKENQLSIESSALQNGQFTYYFVDQGMVSKQADVNHDALVTFEEAFDYASVYCQRQTPTSFDGFVNDMLP